MARPACSVFLATSLDGFIARPDGGIDWLRAVERPGEDYGYAAFAATVDTLVLGRRSYDVVLGMPEWPYPRGKRVVVMTRRPIAPRGDDQTFAGDPERLVSDLGARGAQRIYVDGGEIVRAFLAADLVDDLTISIIPIVLGDGIPLFARGMAERRLRCTASRGYESGLVQVRYEVARGG
jgi:dihydrofolate reductase